MKDQSKKHMKGIVTRYILAILFALSWAVLGVALAIEGAKVSVAGNINFEASGVQAEVTGSITGTAKTLTLDKLTFDYATTSFSTPSSWKNLDLTFAEGKKEITIEITVENLNKERSFYIVPTVNISANNLKITEKVGDKVGDEIDYEEVSAFSPIECAPLATKAIAIIAEVENEYTAITNQSFKLNFELSETIKNESDLSGLAFTYSSDGTAKVSGADSSLTKVVIPDKVVCKDSSGGGTAGSLYKVTSISSSAFSGYSNLTSVTIPDSVTSIERSAFENCTSLTSITIPSSVTSIEERAFNGCTSLTSITIPSGVTSIEISAFEDCTSLTSITIPDSVRYIYSEAFRGCTSLTSVTIPSGVTSIGVAAFAYCSGLTSVTIPSSVTSIGVAAFAYCSGLTSINVENGNTVYHSAGNCIIETASKTLIAGCKTFVIPIDGSVTSIGNYAFEGCTGLTSITIPNSVTSIGNSAFYGCTGLTSITIPSSVTSIGNHAFCDCTSLTSVTFEDLYHWKAEDRGSTTYLNLSDSAQNAIYLTFNYASSAWTKTAPDASEFLTLEFSALSDGTAQVAQNTSNKPTGDLVIPSKVLINGTEYTVTEVAEKGFEACADVTSVTIPNSITTLNKYAFRSCKKLTSINIPASVTNIDWGSFESCSVLREMTVDSNNAVYESEANGIYTKNGTKLVSACSTTVIREGTTEIADAAFCGATLTSITLPSSLKIIGRYAFGALKNLTSITIPSGVTSIGDDAFTGCSSLTTVCIDSKTIANALTSATDCGGLVNGLSTIYIKSGVYSVGSYISENYVSARSSDKTGYTRYITDIKSFKLISSEPDINNVAQEKVFTEDGELHLLTSEASFQIQVDAPFEMSEYFNKFDDAFEVTILDDGYSYSDGMQVKSNYYYDDNGDYISWRIDDDGNFTIEGAYYVIGRSVQVSYRNGKQEIKVSIYSEASRAYLYDHDYTEMTDNGERGLQQLRVFGNQSYYNGSLKNYYRVYDSTGYWYSDSNILPTWSVNNGASLTTGYESGAHCLDIDFSNVTPCTFDEIYNCTDPSTLTNGVVQLVAKNYFGHVLKTYTFIVVEGINVFDADGYLNAGKTLVMQTDLEYNGSNSSKNLDGYNYKTTIYGNGHKINYGWRNDDETYGKQEPSYINNGYIPVVVTNLINIEIQGAAYDSTKESYNIQLQDIQKMAYCYVHDMCRILGHNSGTVDMKNCVFSRCKVAGIYLAGSTTSLSSDEKTLNLENIIMFDVGSRALELQYKSTVNISGFFEVYNFQNKASLSDSGLSNTEISLVISSAESSGVTMTRDGETWVNVVGISTKTTGVNVNGGNLTKINGILNAYYAWAYTPDQTSTSGAIMSYDNEFNSDGSLNTTYLESQLTKVSRKGNS